MSYYSISFSLKIYNAIKTNKSINITSFSKNYFYILLIFIVALTLTSIFEVYLSTNIIKSLFLFYILNGMKWRKKWKIKN